MVTYINYGEGEDDATVQAAEWLRKVLREKEPEREEAFYKKFKELYSDDENKTFDVPAIFQLFRDSSSDLFTSINESQARSEDRLREVESFYAVLLSFLINFENDSDVETSTEKLCQTFSEKADELPELRLRLLMMLYNTFPTDLAATKVHGECRLKVFMRILDYAAKADRFEEVAPYLEYLECWMADWDAFLDAAGRRKIYLDVSRHLRALGKRGDAFKYLKKSLMLFQGAAKKELEGKEAQDGALRAVQDSLQLPSVMQVDDVLRLSVVEVLGKSKDGKELVALLTLLLGGSIDDLRAFQKKNAKVFKDFDITFEDVLDKLRLLTLSTACQGKSELPLETVAQVLQEEGGVDKVERWVVKLISEGVVDGKIDQINKKLLCKSAFQRKFEKSEWQFLDSKLTQWTTNLEDLLRLMEESRVERQEEMSTRKAAVAAKAAK